MHVHVFVFWLYLKFILQDYNILTAKNIKILIVWIVFKMNEIETAWKEYFDLNRPKYSLKQLLDASNELPNPNGYPSGIRVINIDRLK